MTGHQIGELFRRYRGYLIAVIRSRLFTGCPNDYILDLLDDVFTIALEKKDDEKFNRDPIGWLVVTTKFVVENFNRKQLGRDRYHDSDFDFNLHEIPCSDTMLEDLALKMAIENKIWDKVLEDLSPDDRVVLIMRYFQNKSPKEIAKVLHIKENAAKVRITRMKEKVRKLIRKHVGEC